MDENSRLTLDFAPLPTRPSTFGTTSGRTSISVGRRR